MFIVLSNLNFISAVLKLIFCIEQIMATRFANDKVTLKLVIKSSS